MDKKNKVEAVIFDMDGLMFDTEPLFFLSEIEVAKKYGKIFTVDIQVKMMGQKGVHAIETMCKELDIAEDPEKLMIERDELYIELLKTKSQAKLGLLELLDLLDAHKIRKAIATSSNRVWVDILLARANILNRFEFIVTGDDVKVGKPDPEIYLKAVDLLNLSASSCLVLEDAINGIRAGKAAGCVVVAVPDKHTSHQDFSEADYSVESLIDEQLINILKF